MNKFDAYAHLMQLGPPICSAPFFCVFFFYPPNSVTKSIYRINKQREPKLSSFVLPHFFERAVRILKRQNSGKMFRFVFPRVGICMFRLLLFCPSARPAIRLSTQNIRPPRAGMATE